MNKWPKPEAGYAIYHSVNLHICIRSRWLLSVIMNHHGMVMNHLKLQSQFNKHLKKFVRATGYTFVATGDYLDPPRRGLSCNFNFSYSQLDANISNYLYYY